MAITAAEVQSFLEQEVRGPESMVNITDEFGHIGGFVVRPEFDGQTISTRQKSLWDSLRNRFGEEAGEIGMIFTYSPYEYDEIFAEESA